MHCSLRLWLLAENDFHGQSMSKRPKVMTKLQPLAAEESDEVWQLHLPWLFLFPKHLCFAFLTLAKTHNTHNTHNTRMSKTQSPSLVACARACMYMFVPPCFCMPVLPCGWGQFCLHSR